MNYMKQTVSHTITHVRNSVADTDQEEPNQPSN